MSGLCMSFSNWYHCLNRSDTHLTTLKPPQQCDLYLHYIITNCRQSHITTALDSCHNSQLMASHIVFGKVIGDVVEICQCHKDFVLWPISCHITITYFIYPAYLFIWYSFQLWTKIWSRERYHPCRFMLC